MDGWFNTICGAVVGYNNKLLQNARVYVPMCQFTPSMGNNYPSELPLQSSIHGTHSFHAMIVQHIFLTKLPKPSRAVEVCLVSWFCVSQEQMVPQIFSALRPCLQASLEKVASFGCHSDYSRPPVCVCMWWCVSVRVRFPRE